jgi:hypothetical protein
MIKRWIDVGAGYQPPVITIKNIRDKVMKW